MKDYFSGTENYVATDELALAVNAAITLERPLLIKGEPVLVRLCWLKRWQIRLGSH